MTMLAIGRLAFRQEGNFWNAYWTKGPMSEAIQIGSIRMTAIVGKPAVKESFMETMKLAFNGFVEDSSGVTPQWSEPRTAPENERSGNA